MKSRRTFAFLILLAAIISGFAFYILSSSREPVYQGKRLSEWLKIYANSEVTGQGESQAAEAIRGIGTNSLPILLKWINSNDSTLIEKAITLIRKQSLIKCPWYTAGEHRIIARMGFTVLGSNAAPAVTALIGLLNASDDVDVQAEALMSLGRIGPAAQEAVPAIIKCLKGTNHYAALFAPNTMALIHKQPELAVPALIQHLEETKRKPLHLRRTIKALGDFGNEAKAAVPHLLVFLNDQDAEARSFTTNALKQIDSEAAAKAGVH